MGLIERETASVVPATSVFAQRAQVQSLYCPLRAFYVFAMREGALDMEPFFSQFARGFLCRQFIDDGSGWSCIDLQGAAHVVNPAALTHCLSIAMCCAVCSMIGKSFSEQSNVNSLIMSMMRRQV